MITQNLGKIGITPKGQYVAGSYERLDLVTDNGSSYLSLKDNNVSDLTVKADWMVVAEKGKAFEYSDFTPEQIVELQRPATDAIASIQAVELSVEQAEAFRVQAEIDRQTNTATAIQNAETATTNASNAAILANEKAGLANDAALLANEKAGLAATATTQANTARDGANSAAQSATNLVNTYAAELAAKELKANKQNSLAPDGTGTKFPTVDAVNAKIATISGEILTTYIHSGNKEVYVTSINYATNTFTSVGHGLVNDDRLFIAMIGNSAIEVVLPIRASMPVTSNDCGYFVINATADTFSLSITSGGSAIPLYNKAGIDLSKWRFEKSSINKVFDFTNITNRGVKIDILGHIGRVPRYVYPSVALTYTQGYNNTGTTQTYLTHDSLYLIYGRYIVEISNNNGRIYTKREWYGITLDNTNENKIVPVNGVIYQSNNDTIANLTGVRLGTMNISNGTMIRITLL